MQKIAIIGNSGGGKTALARHLGQLYGLPVTHVDSIQFLPGMKIRPHAESIQILSEIQTREAWIIDGYGPLDILTGRLALADQIYFIDLPIWRHFWWCTKRQVKNIFSRRAELVEGCNELTFEHTKKLYQSLWQVHTKMRPEMLRILGREPLCEKTMHVHTLHQLRELMRP